MYPMFSLLWQTSCTCRKFKILKIGPNKWRKLRVVLKGVKMKHTLLSPLFFFTLWCHFWYVSGNGSITIIVLHFWNQAIFYECSILGKEWYCYVHVMPCFSGCRHFLEKHTLLCMYLVQKHVSQNRCVQVTCSLK